MPFRTWTMSTEASHLTFECKCEEVTTTHWKMAREGFMEVAISITDILFQQSTNNILHCESTYPTEPPYDQKQLFLLMPSTYSSPAMAPINETKHFERPPEPLSSIYPLAALLFGCICFILTPVINHDDFLSLPSRRQFLRSGLKTSTQHEALGFCPICKDRLFEAVRLPCSHIYCDDCIRTALSNGHRMCPYCRRLLFCESLLWEDVADRARFTFWCISLVGFLTLNIWASARYLQWRSEMMWRWDYFLEIELVVHLTFVALMSWVFPVPLVSQPEQPGWEEGTVNGWH